MIQVVWFKRDLRTVDHRPLAEAAAAGPVIPLYVVEPEYWRLPDTSRRQWLVAHGALVELAGRLSAIGAPLIVRIGNVVEVLAKIHAAVGIARLLAHEETGNLWTFERDIAVHRFCRRHQVPFVEYSQTGLIRGAPARDAWAAHYGRFIAAPIVPEPARISPAFAPKRLDLPAVDCLELADDGCAAPQDGTRRAALDLLASFLDGRGADYRRAMSSPLSGAHSCSRLSVALSVGTISVREVLQHVYQRRRELLECPIPHRAIPVAAVDSLIARLHWRGHFMQKLESEPEIEERSFHPLHQRARTLTFPDDPRLHAWAKGRTGIPFVDACMRSLIETGWLNFRMRAMVQAFASYHLALDWRASGERLAQLFSDYEPGIHWPQVQMQSGQTGINAPRIYNPIKQAIDQDPEGAFTRRWVPELARLPISTLQMPWVSNDAAATVYPAPIVDPAAAARDARDRLTAIRRSEGYGDAAAVVFRNHGSRNRPLNDDSTRFRGGKRRRPSPQLVLPLKS